jgi:hypothetical protein
MTEETHSLREIQLEEKLRVAEALAEERRMSNDLYAIKLVERIVFGLVALVITSVTGAIIALVVSR